MSRAVLWDTILLPGPRGRCDRRPDGTLPETYVDNGATKCCQDGFQQFQQAPMTASARGLHHAVSTVIRTSRHAAWPPAAAASVRAVV